MSDNEAKAVPATNATASSGVRGGWPDGAAPEARWNLRCDSYYLRRPDPARWCPELGMEHLVDSLCKEKRDASVPEVVKAVIRQRPSPEQRLPIPVV
jgi:hypothetical protein